MKRSAPKRSTKPIKQFSKKRAALQVKRREFVKKYLLEHPYCVVRWDNECQHYSSDVNEIVKRSRGGGILDESNVCAVCRICHDKLELYPKEATERGFLKRRSN